MGYELHLREQRLPTEYQEVSWISADAGVAAYLNLGIKFDTACKVEIGTYITDAVTTYLFGAAENSGIYRCMITSQYQNSYTIAGWGSNGTDFLGHTCETVDGLNEIEYVLIPNEEYFVKNNTNNSASPMGSTSLASYTMTSDLYLFAQNYNGSIRYSGHRQVSYFKYYDKNNVLICDLVPCYRKSDQAIGMYDLARDIFLTSVGTSTFTKGSEIKVVNITIPEGQVIKICDVENLVTSWQDGVRLSSTTNETAEHSEATLLNFMPCTKNDILYVEGCEWKGAWNETNPLYSYIEWLSDADPTKRIGSFNSNNTEHSGIVISFPDANIKSKFIIDFTGYTGTKDFSYIRLSLAGKGSQCIVSKNKPIKPIWELILFNNLILTATETDKTTIYNGGLGYKDGWRWSSSGKKESEAANGRITGLMPHTSGATCRIQGFDADTSGYVANFYYIGYKEDGSITTHTFNTSTNAEYDSINDIATFTTPSANYTHFRISGYKTALKPPVVTINEEIL